MPNPAGDRQHLPNRGACELFDLQSDPRENANVAKRPEYASVVEEMERLLQAGWERMLPEAKSFTGLDCAVMNIEHRTLNIEH